MVKLPPPFNNYIKWFRAIYMYHVLQGFFCLIYFGVPVGMGLPYIVHGGGWAPLP